MKLEVFVVLSREHETSPLKICTVVAGSAQEVADYIRKEYPLLKIVSIAESKTDWK